MERKIEQQLTALKYFCEETWEYHISAADSLLGVALYRQYYSFPVGKVEMLPLYPLDFEEYLWARDKRLLAQEIRKTWHHCRRRCIRKQRNCIRNIYSSAEYRPVSTPFLRTGSFLDVSLIQWRILDNYIADMA